MAIPSREFHILWIVIGTVAVISVSLIAFGVRIGALVRDVDGASLNPKLVAAYRSQSPSPRTYKLAVNSLEGCFSVQQDARELLHALTQLFVAAGVGIVALVMIAARGLWVVYRALNAPSPTKAEPPSS